MVGLAGLSWTTTARISSWQPEATHAAKQPPDVLTLTLRLRSPSLSRSHTPRIQTWQTTAVNSEETRDGSIAVVLVVAEASKIVSAAYAIDSSSSSATACGAYEPPAGCVFRDSVSLGASVLGTVFAPGRTSSLRSCGVSR